MRELEAGPGVRIRPDLRLDVDVPARVPARVDRGERRSPFASSLRKLAMNTAPTQPVRDLDDNDRVIGRILSRREVLALFCAGGVALTIAACVPAGLSSASAGASASTGAATASVTPASKRRRLPRRDRRRSGAIVRRWSWS